MLEQWRDVVGFEGFYEVSNDGQVRNCQTRHVRRVNKDRHGYLWLTLCKNGERHFRQVHRLVGDAFLGVPAEGMEINHRNGITTDNRVSNLEWMTRKENRNHACEVLGRHKAMNRICGKGTQNGYAKLVDDEVRQIRILYRKGNTTCEKLGQQFGVGRSTIYRIVTWQNWTHVK